MTRSLGAWTFDIVEQSMHAHSLIRFPFVFDGEGVCKFGPMPEETVMQHDFSNSRNASALLVSLIKRSRNGELRQPGGAGSASLIA
jgi:hypothetical protein